MILKSLELQGFKTFPDKTTLSFEQGVTSVVGPNGSGKSNISDAMRWVLGEQSVRSLRCSKMEDVVFGGTPQRKALGFAEVTLTIDNSDRRLPFDNDQVAITRRYYRSGESEYLINKSTVRLRDINELFMDITSRLLALREAMEREGLDAYIVSGTDPHNSEYLPEAWKQREWMSGFTGSFGTLVVLKDQAGLWTDSRYFIQAEKQLKNSGIQLHKLRMPGSLDYPEWLSSTLPQKGRVGLDCFCISVVEMKRLKKNGNRIWN